MFMTTEMEIIAASTFLHLVAAALEDTRMTTPAIGIQLAPRDLPVLS